MTCGKATLGPSSSGSVETTTPPAASMQRWHPRVGSRILCMQTAQDRMHARYPDDVGTTVQIRNLSDDVTRKLKAQAAAADLSLSEYLRRELTELAEQAKPSVVNLFPLQGPAKSREPAGDRPLLR